MELGRLRDMEAYAGGVGSSNAAEKERSYAGAGSKKVKKKNRAAGWKKAEKERALLLLKDLELYEEKAHAGSKMKEEKDLEFPFSFRIGAAGQEEEGGGESKAGGGIKRRKKTNPLPPMYPPVPGLVDPLTIDLQESSVAKQMVEREADHDSILKIIKAFMAAGVPEFYEDTLCGMDGVNKAA